MGRWFWSLSLVAVLAAFAWFVVAVPAALSAGVAAVIACGFCSWLDHEPHDSTGVRSRARGTSLALTLAAARAAASGSAYAQEAGSQPTQ